MIEQSKGEETKNVKSLRSSIYSFSCTRFDVFIHQLFPIPCVYRNKKVPNEKFRSLKRDNINSEEETTRVREEKLLNLKLTIMLIRAIASTTAMNVSDQPSGMEFFNALKTKERFRVVAPKPKTYLT